jgi:hypothetical protein
MNHGDLMDVRRVDDEFPAIGKHGLQLVHALAAHPELIIHARCAR